MQRYIVRLQGVQDREKHRPLRDSGFDWLGQQAHFLNAETKTLTKALGTLRNSAAIVLERRLDTPVCIYSVMQWTR
ncbi:hypothetical protein EVAR_84562_1 [Eumeta japonica]|uniref:Uncharacterized protein n=1 Tax=Eumeta variegata TaxID=151549 RepID=A0A4C1UJ57_EUMVA|nr:hypothetical protein EVAR_84562_1 [Eumeta japonica]